MLANTSNQNRIDSLSHLSVPHNNPGQKVEHVKITEDGKFIQDVALNKQVKLKLKYTVPLEEGEDVEQRLEGTEASEKKIPEKQEEE